MSDKIIPRKYQKEAIDAALAIPKGKNGLLVLPTGAGKSIVIAEIVAQSNKKTIILQPTKEILEQNLSKIKNYLPNKDIGVFSASMDEKTISKATFATIGTIIKHKKKFKHFDKIIVDEAHLVNSKGGQYEEFINTLDIPVIGLTATPYRMKYYCNTFGNNEPVVESRFLTRTRPRIFNSIAHITQVPDLFNQEFLCPVKYDYQNSYDSRKIKSNSTGQGYDEKSLLKYNKEKNIVPQIVSEVKESKAKHILIFTQFRSESQQIISALNGYVECKEVSGETKKRDRESILKKFKSGKLRCVVNVGVLTVGFDFPGLDCIMIGRPTKSIALFYQMSGRGLRPSQGKDFCEIIDFCDNTKRFGEINSFVIEDPSGGRGLWRLKSNIGYLTGVNLLTGKDLEKRNTTTKKDKKLAESGKLVLPFGKFRGEMLSGIDQGYLEWCIKNFDKDNKWVDIFQNEIARRSYIEPEKGLC